MNRELFDHDELLLIRTAVMDFRENFKKDSSYYMTASDILNKIETELTWWNSGK